MEKYEYLTRSDINQFDFPQNELNTLGREGWEFVATDQRTSFTVYIFKRKIYEKEVVKNHCLPQNKINI